MDAALAELGLSRRVVGSVGTLPASLHLLADSDPVGLGTAGSARLPHRLGPRILEVPPALPPLDRALARHPRHEADPAHRLLRELVRQEALRQAREEVAGGTPGVTAPGA